MHPYIIGGLLVYGVVAFSLGVVFNKIVVAEETKLSHALAAAARAELAKAEALVEKPKGKL